MKGQGVATGRTVPVTGAVAFVPDPPPVELALDATTIRMLAAAQHALGELAGVANRLENPRLYANALIRREALVSSRIEGTVATPGDLARAELGLGGGAEAMEVHNFVDATEHALKQIGKDAAISLTLMLDAHRVLMKGVRGGREMPGEFRMAQNWIGGAGGIERARFVPPPPQELAALLRDLERYMNDDASGAADLPPLIRTAVAHYQFETIHPFRDGNGRIGRMLIMLMLVRHKLLPRAVLPISTAIEQRKTEYADRMLAVSQRGEWAEWVRFFLECTADAANGALAFLRRLEGLKDRWYEKVQSSRASARLIKVVDALFVRPVLTIGEAGDIMRVTPAAAAAGVARLEKLGILTEVTHRKRDRAYVARAIITLLNEDLPT